MGNSFLFSAPQVLQNSWLNEIIYDASYDIHVIFIMYLLDNVQQFVLNIFKLTSRFYGKLENTYCMNFVIGNLNIVFKLLVN